MKTYKIHFIRNGMTAANVDGRYIGHTDEPLSEQGKKELFELSKKGGYPDPQAVFVSPLARCAETTAILFPEKKPIIINDLIEYNFGEFEGKTAAELHNHPLFFRLACGQSGCRSSFWRKRCGFFKKDYAGLQRNCHRGVENRHNRNGHCYPRGRYSGAVGQLRFTRIAPARVVYLGRLRLYREYYAFGMDKSGKG